MGGISGLIARLAGGDELHLRRRVAGLLDKRLGNLAARTGRRRDRVEGGSGRPQGEPGAAVRGGCRHGEARVQGLASAGVPISVRALRCVGTMFRLTLSSGSMTSLNTLSWTSEENSCERDEGARESRTHTLGATEARERRDALLFLACQPTG